MPSPSCRNEYLWLWYPDDDLIFQPGDMDRFLGIVAGTSHFQLLQASLCSGSKYFHPEYLQDTKIKVRVVTDVARYCHRHRLCASPPIQADSGARGGCPFAIPPHPSRCVNTHFPVYPLNQIFPVLRPQVPIVHIHTVELQMPMGRVQWWIVRTPSYPAASPDL